MNLKRVNVLKESKDLSGPIVYWMQRDQRVQDNWALFYAYKLAIEQKNNLLLSST